MSLLFIILSQYFDCIVAKNILPGARALFQRLLSPRIHERELSSTGVYIGRTRCQQDNYGNCWFYCLNLRHKIKLSKLLTVMGVGTNPIKWLKNLPYWESINNVSHCTRHSYKVIKPALYLKCMNIIKVCKLRKFIFIKALGPGMGFSLPYSSPRIVFFQNILHLGLLSWYYE